MGYAKIVRGSARNKHINGWPCLKVTRPKNRVYHCTKVAGEALAKPLSGLSWIQLQPKSLYLSFATDSDSVSDELLVQSFRIALLVSSPPAKRLGERGHGSLNIVRVRAPVTNAHAHRTGCFPSRAG